jgi:hypothetical protein
MRGCRQRQKHQLSEPSIHFLTYGFYINYYSLQRLVPKRTYQLHVLREFKGRFPLRPYRTVTYRWACADWKEVYSRIKIKSSSQVNYLAYYGSTNQSTFTKFWNLKFVLIRYGTLLLKWKTALMVRIFQRITVMRLQCEHLVWSLTWASVESFLKYWIFDNGFRTTYNCIVLASISPFAV